MYRCHSCGKNFQKRAKKCPSCNSEGITLVPDPKSHAGCGALVGLVIAAAAAAGVLGYMGFINIPGLTPSKGPEVQDLRPPEDKPVSKDGKKAPIDDGAGVPKVEKIEPRAPDATPTSKPTALYPPVAAQDLEKALALYNKGDFAGARKALDGCERPEVASEGATAEARAVSRKARILEAITKKIPLSPLATAKKLEQVSTSSGRPMIGIVTESDDKITIVVAGGISTEIKKDDIGERGPADRSALVEKLRAGLEDRKARVKADDALSNFRLGNYCWQYALDEDAVPFLDKAVLGDDFPTVARVFGGSETASILQTWCDLTGKTVAGVPGKAPRGKTPGLTPSGATPPDTTPTQPAAPGNVADIARRARAKYDEGLAKYRLSYGDTREAHAAHVAALHLFQEARDILAAANEDPSVEDLQHDINLVLMDCRKRPI